MKPTFPPSPFIQVRCSVAAKPCQLARLLATEAEKISIVVKYIENGALIESVSLI
jgi:hypothetical protein